MLEQQSLISTSSCELHINGLCPDTSCSQALPHHRGFPLTNSLKITGRKVKKNMGCVLIGKRLQRARKHQLKSRFNMQKQCCGPLETHFGSHDYSFRLAEPISSAAAAQV